MDQQADVIWRAGGVPVSRRFDDPYFSLEDGLSETRHVFLGGNCLPARFRDGFEVAELGFGTGLNLLATLAAWQAAGAPGEMMFTSFEAHLLETPDMARALAAFPGLGSSVGRLLEVHEAARFRTVALSDGLWLRIVVGRAQETLPHWNGRADAWFLDGFAPARNPDLWSPGLMAEVAEHTRPGGTAATYTAAGAVRRGLAAAGFEVTRVPGFGRKRHMTVARMPA